MRLEKLQRVKLFVTFDLLVDFGYLYSYYRKTHEKQQLQFVLWPTSATRSYLISDYWYYAFVHYLILISLGSIGCLLLHGELTTNYLFLNVLVGIALYLPLYLLIYKPTFSGIFLPLLENVIATYEGRKQSWMEKCKQEQLSTRGLVLLYYILDKCAGINYLTPSDRSASMLLKIFGVSHKGLKNELDLLFKKEKRTKVEQRKHTEIAKSFEEVYALLNEMQFPKGIQMLKELEIRFNRPE